MKFSSLSVLALAASFSGALAGAPAAGKKSGGGGSGGMSGPGMSVGGKKGGGGPPGLMRILIGGGIQAAVAPAAEEGRSGGGYANGDIVMITDGEIAEPVPPGCSGDTCSDNTEFYVETDDDMVSLAYFRDCVEANGVQLLEVTCPTPSDGATVTTTCTTSSKTGEEPVEIDGECEATVTPAGVENDVWFSVAFDTGYGGYRELKEGERALGYKKNNAPGPDCTLKIDMMIECGPGIGMTPPTRN